jgi:hypothetical protein
MANETDEYEIMIRLRGALNESVGCVSQLIHVRPGHEVGWMTVRSLLEKTRDMIGQFAESRSVTRQATLLDLDRWVKDMRN